MKPTIFENHESMSAAAADWLAKKLAAKGDSLICLATGSTPTRTYELLAEKGSRNPQLLQSARILKLDEWGGIPMTSPASCEVFLQDLLIKPLNLQSRYNGFVSQPANPKDECKRIEDFLAKNGPADICILGLGLNGHLGFNEPAPALQPNPHVAQLSAESLSHSMLALEPIKPGYGLTLGIGNILASRDVLLLVSGASKRAALKRTLEPSISTNFPASFLWLHQNAHVFCDKAAIGS